MPADAQPVAHGMTLTAMALPSGAAGFTLTFGTYDEPSFVGMAVKIRLSQPLVYVATGEVSQVFWTATVGSDGTASITGLPYNDDPAFWPTPSTYTAEWQALAWKPTPGDKTFQVLRSAGPTVDYDLIGYPGYTPITTALVGSALVGTSIVG